MVPPAISADSTRASSPVRAMRALSASASDDERKAPDADYFAGSISCSYINRESGLSQARSLAYQVARQRGFETDGADRYYIICCMTKNGCATKVR